MIDITGIDVAKLLAALFNASKPQGMGFLQPFAEPMTRDEAAELLARDSYFDYVRGRVMKIQLKEGQHSLDPWLYDRDNGQGAAQRVVESLR